MNKKRYELRIHGHNLEVYCELDQWVKACQRLMRFHQSPWMTPYMIAKTWSSGKARRVIWNKLLTEFVVFVSKCFLMPVKMWEASKGCEEVGFA